MEFEPDQARNYPPSLLEWKAARKQLGMAVEGIFPDDKRMPGPIESWTTGNDFASHLLQCM